MSSCQFTLLPEKYDFFKLGGGVPPPPPSHTPMMIQKGRNGYICLNYTWRMRVDRITVRILIRKCGRILTGQGEEDHVKIK